MVLAQNWAFFKLFSLGNIGHKNVFYNILEPKTTFWAGKTKTLKDRKIDIFPKGLIHGFGAKLNTFQTVFFLGNIEQETVFYDILQRQNQRSKP